MDPRFLITNLGQWRKPGHDGSGHPAQVTLIGSTSKGYIRGMSKITHFYLFMSLCVKFLLKNAARQVSIDIQLTSQLSTSNRRMTTHDQARYHDFYRRHRFAWTKRKGGWDVGNPGSFDEKIRCFWMFFSTCLFHTYKTHVVKMDCPIVSRRIEPTFLRV